MFVLELEKFVQNRNVHPIINHLETYIFAHDEINETYSAHYI